jgi:predicted alpha/beta hydrolase family esterase
MFKKIKEFFVGKPAPVAEVAYKVETPALATPVASAPVVEEVKVETPAPTVGHDLGGSYTTEAAPAVEVVVEGTGAVAVPTKKTRKPRAPKVVAEKPAAKKAAPVKKAAAIKAKPTATRSKKV